jgi:hypothetical protein
MSTPYEKELGEWNSPTTVLENPELFPNHQEFYKEILKLTPIQQDEAFKKRCYQNILHNPKKCCENWMANVGRLLFSYPFSYTDQKLSTYLYILPNMFIVVLSILCIYPSYLARRSVPYEIYALVLFGLIAFGGASLVSAEDRQFRPLVPIFALWIIFTLTRSLKIEFRQ